MIFTTSISPINSERQKNAINSWRFYDLPIFSVNHESEINELKKEFPFVQFISIDKSAYEFYKKHYIYAHDIIYKSFENCTDDSIFLINSDIELHPEKLKFKLNELDYFERLSESSLICFKRFDKKGKQLKCYNIGNDGFIINRKFLLIIKESKFVLGQCFWDWWLPMIFFQNKKSTWTFNQLYLIHELHERTYGDELWKYNFELFKDEFGWLLKEDWVITKAFYNLITADSRTCNNFKIKV